MANNQEIKRVTTTTNNNKNVTWVLDAAGEKTAPPLISTTKNHNKNIQTSSDGTKELFLTPKQIPRKMQTQISKLIYDPRNSGPTTGIVKSVHTYGPVITSTFSFKQNQSETPQIQTSSSHAQIQFDNKNSLPVKEQPILEMKPPAIDTFKTRDMNKIHDKKPTNDSSMVKSNEEFMKRKLEREKDIEDIQSMLNQISVNDNETLTNVNLKSISESKAQASALLHLKEKSFQRSQTEITLKTTDCNHKNIDQLSPLKTNSIQRSKSSINLMSTNSSQKPPPDKVQKKKFYDPHEARLFMKEQRIKRKLTNQNTTNNPENVQKKNPPIDKEAIKKRLEDLRKNSLKILEKNLRPTKNRRTKTSDPICISPSKSRKMEIFNGPTSQINNSSKAMTVLKPLNSKKNLKLEKTPRDGGSERSNSINNSSKKIGLLRKTETQDHSFSVLDNFHINKENIIALENPLKSPPIHANQDTKVTPVDDNIADVITEAATKKSNESEKLIENKNSSLTQSQCQDLELKIPNAKLKTKVSLCEKSVQVENVPLQKEPKNQIPYWLKPTPVQIYPYSFIMAVRKKLEAITKTSVTTQNQPEKKHTNQETPLKYTKKKRAETVPRRIVDEKTFDNKLENFSMQNVHHHINLSDNIQHNTINNRRRPVEIKIPTFPAAKTNIPSVPPININDDKQNTRDFSSKSLSEMTSNFSSISVHVPEESNTISEISSIHSETAGGSNKNKKKIQFSQPINSTKITENQNFHNQHNSSNNNEDDTTISSSVFSSPEKATASSKTLTNIDKKTAQKSNISEEIIISPLSLNNISNLQIQTKNTHKKNHNDNLQMPTIHLKENSKSENFTKSREKQYQKVQSARSCSASINSNNYDFSQLLSDFNKSLSQVIEVNDKLKATLEKSNQISSPSSKSSSQRENNIVKNTIFKNSFKSLTDNYTSDFEEVSKEININENTNHILSQTDGVCVPERPCNSTKTVEFQAKDRYLGGGRPTDAATRKTTVANSHDPDKVHKPTHVVGAARTEDRIFVGNRLVTDTTNHISSSSSVSPSNIIKSLTVNSNDMKSPTISSQSILENIVVNSNKEIITNNSSNPRLNSSQEEYLDSMEEEDVTTIKSSNSIITEQITNSINNKKHEEINIEINEENDNLLVTNTEEKIGENMKKMIDNRVEYVLNHINNSRGDFNDPSVTENIMKSNQSSNTGPPAYVKSSKARTPDLLSVSSEFIAVFNRSDTEVSMYSHNESNLSETTLNYSSIGMYEKLLQNENNKSEQLATLLKIREKALIDRTKGQIAWLEVQKEKYRSKGLASEISAIKKKQRAILLKMEKERTEIKKLLQNQQPRLSSSKLARNRGELPRSYHHPKLANNIPDTTIRRRSLKISNQTTIATTATAIATTTNRSHKIIRGFELETSQSLENILQKREEELRKRRAHVERLMEWHQRLDKEEEDVINLEQMLYEHTSSANLQKPPIPENQSLISFNNQELNQQSKIHQKIVEIDKSLQELQSIPSKGSNEKTGNATDLDFVCTSGLKLNKLWRRLTGIKRTDKFIETMKYKLFKHDLENLYEEAKKEVLKEFENKDEIMELFEQSKQNNTANTTNGTGGTNSLCYDDSSYNEIPNSPTKSVKLDIQNLNEAAIQNTLEEHQDICKEEINPLSLDISLKVNESIEIDSNLGKHVAEVELDDIPKTLDESIQFVCKNIQQNSEIINIISKNTEPIKEVTSPVEISVVNLDIMEEDEINKIEETVIENLNSCFSSVSEESLSEEHSQIRESISSECKTESKVDEEISKTVNDANVKSTNADLADVIQQNSHSTNISDNLSSMEQVIHEENSSKTSFLLSQQDDIVSEQGNEMVELTSKLNESPTENSAAELIVTLQAEIEKYEDFNQVNDTNLNLQLIEPTNSSENSEQKYETITTEDDVLQIEENIEIDLTATTENPSDVMSNDKNDIKTNSLEISEYSNSEKYDTTNNTFESSSSSDLDEFKMTFDSPRLTASNQTFTVPDTVTLTPNVNPQSPPPEHSTAEFAFDFSANETLLEDLSMPKFEATLEEESILNSELNFCEIDNVIQRDTTEQMTSVPATAGTTELEQRLIDLDVSLKGLNDTIDRALSPDKSVSSPTQFSLAKPPSSAVSDDNLDLEQKVSVPSQNYLTSCQENSTIMMPDIINEVELLRRQKIIIDTEPYLFVREIPNKPPPPYVPPAHGSPMTIIFPSEQRITDITYRRTKELYFEMTKTEICTTNNECSTTTATALPGTIEFSSILNENITNIYERIILDVCKECMDEYQEIFMNFNPETYKNSLALFNPPDRLKYMQNLIHQHIRKLLGIDKKSNAASFSFNKNSIFAIGRRKCDHVDEILIQELYEEELKWSNFTIEEDEVKLAIIDEICNDIIEELILEEMSYSNDNELSSSICQSSITSNNENDNHPPPPE